MTDTPHQIDLNAWEGRWPEIQRTRADWPAYVGPLGRHVEDGDTRLRSLRFDNSPAAFRLWNFLLTEEDRLRAARAEGFKLVGTMKDLGTVPVLAYSLPNAVAFYPDGAWWIPCVMELNANLLGIADRLGVDDSFCPVRAMLGAFVTEAHFPLPDLLACSVGATCDDFSAIAQRLAGLGHPILWWEMPHRRAPDPEEAAVELPGGFLAPASQVALVRSELERVARALENLCGEALTDERLATGIQRANAVRRTLGELRRLAFTAEPCPLPALELLIAEMLAIHFCSDQAECLVVIEDLLAETRRRVQAGQGTLKPGTPRIFWVNPVADLAAMNLLEACGGRLCGTDFLFSHALDPIPEDLDPFEALARMALADPMVGSGSDRARRICADIRATGAQAVVVSRIPGASHCAWEGRVIRDRVQTELDLPVVEIEVPPLGDALQSSHRTRLEALVETIQNKSI